MLRAWQKDLASLDGLAGVGQVKLVGSDRIEASGPAVGLGSTVAIEREASTELLAEVVGFRSGSLVLAPFGSVEGLEPQARVRVARVEQRAPASALLGRVVDGLGRGIDGGRSPRSSGVGQARRRSAAQATQDVSEVFETGVRSIDALLSCGLGQRVGIFAGAGLGKSTLLSMLLRGVRADAVVLALVGERGREVRRFVDRELDDESRRRTVVVASTAAEPALMRRRAAELAAELAEELAEEGKQVVLIMDSLTRLAMAQRELGLASGEAPTSKGYPPSVFALLPRLLERAGVRERGSVTAFYSILVEGDDLKDPVADSLRGLLDGHVVLSRALAEKGLFPAIDVLQSLSRLMPELCPERQLDAARRVRGWLGARRDAEDLIRIGAYRAGSDPLLDEALERSDATEALLSQEAGSRVRRSEAIEDLMALVDTKETPR